MKNKGKEFEEKFKFDFLKITPIALQRIVDRMSDGYIIVNDETVITDFIILDIWDIYIIRSAMMKRH